MSFENEKYMIIPAGGVRVATKFMLRVPLPIAPLCLVGLVGASGGNAEAKFQSSSSLLEAAGWASEAMMVLVAGGCDGLVEMLLLPSAANGSGVED